MTIRVGVTLGRGPSCDIRLDDPLVSRRHAAVVDVDGALAVSDLDSANGLYVNGRRCRHVVKLRLGDVLQLGGTVWRVVE